VQNTTVITVIYLWERFHLNETQNTMTLSNQTQPQKHPSLIMQSNYNMNLQSCIINVIPRQFTSIRQNLLQHLLPELVIML